MLFPDLLLGYGCSSSDTENQESLFQESNANGYRLVWLYICRRTEHPNFWVSNLEKTYATGNILHFSQTQQSTND